MDQYSIPFKWKPMTSTQCDNLQSLRLQASDAPPHLWSFAAPSAWIRVRNLHKAQIVDLFNFGKTVPQLAGEFGVGTSILHR